MRPSAALLAWLCTAAPLAAEIEVTAQLEPERIGVDEVAVFSIEARGLGFSQLKFRHSFELENLEIVSGPNRFEDFRFVNGDLSHSVRMSWQLRPLKTGTARVHAVSVLLRGQRVDLADQSLTVTERGTSKPRRNSRFPGEPLDPSGHLYGRPPAPWGAYERRGAPQVFVTTSVEPAAPVEGQQVTLTVHLYSNVDLPIINPGPLPALPGFWVRDLPLPANLTVEMVTVDGRRVGRMPLLRKALFPLRAGRFTVAPIQVEVLAQRPGLRFLGAPPQRVAVQTEPVVVEVRPLPPAPPGFSGCVGGLELNAVMEPRTVRLGDAASLILTLRGDGQLQSIAVPEIPMPPGVTLTRPASEIRETIAGGKLQTERVLRFAVIPERAGRHELTLPPVAYFDPRQGAFLQASPAPLTLEVLPRLAASGVDAAVPHGVRRLASAAAPRPKATTLSARLLPWLFAVPWVLGLVAVLARRGKPGTGFRAPASPGARLRRQVKELPEDLSAKDAAVAIEHAWHSFLVERWKIAPGLAPHRWPQEVLRRGVPAAGAEALAQLVQDLELLRHAPQLATTSCLRAEIVAASQRLARALQ